MTRMFGRRTERRRTLIVSAGDVVPGRARRIAATLSMVAIALVGLTFYCHRLLSEAAQGQAVSPTALPFYVAAGCFLLASLAVVVLQSARLSQRVSGPEYRLIQSLRRIRAGDVSFRVHMRRGDLLCGLAEECNALLDWLNSNPPTGARTGTDVYEISALEPEFSEAHA